jgi:hypothetical protein
MKKGFYYKKSEIDERCYYLTGEKSGNKWIYIGGENDGQFMTVSDPTWMSLNWTCIPTEKELEGYTLSNTNPTPYVLEYKQVTIMDEIYRNAKDELDDTLKKLYG